MTIFYTRQRPNRQAHMTSLPPIHAVDPFRFNTPAILKRLNAASRNLAELKGVVAAIPNQAILINAIGLQEAKDSSAIENIVTTHDDLYREMAADENGLNPTAKEVLRYRQALGVGYDKIRATGLLTLNTVLEIQSVLETNNAGLRKLPGTTLKDGDGRTVYTPPQDAREVQRLMGELELFWNGVPPYETDPLILMALIHYQFESIHPFYDGNGRTGRILNVLYLVKERLLETPVLYLSRHIVKTKPDYYRLLQAVRLQDAWEDWVIYMLTAVELTAAETINTVRAINHQLAKTKRELRQLKFYSQDLLNNLFAHPYTKIEFLQRDLQVSRLTASKYLDAIVEGGWLKKQKIGRSNFYINEGLFNILRAAENTPDT
jgi:Fic family protein